MHTAVYAIKHHNRTLTESCNYLYTRGHQSQCTQSPSNSARSTSFQPSHELSPSTTAGGTSIQPSHDPPLEQQRNTTIPKKSTFYITEEHNSTSPYPSKTVAFCSNTDEVRSNHLLRVFFPSSHGWEEEGGAEHPPSRGTLGPRGAGHRGRGRVRERRGRKPTHARHIRSCPAN